MDASLGEGAAGSTSPPPPRRFRLVHVLAGLWFLASVPLAALDVYRCWTIRDRYDAWCARHPERAARTQAAGAPQPPSPWSPVVALVVGSVLTLGLLTSEEEVTTRPLWARIALWIVFLFGSAFFWTFSYSMRGWSVRALDLLEETEKVKPWTPK